MASRALCLSVVMLAGLASARPTTQERPSLETLLERSRDYTVEFVKRFSNVVAEEEYVQSWRNTRLVLESEFLFVQQESGDYLAFRDVFRVNGNPVRDHDDRIAKLFLSPTSKSTDRAAQINAESARLTVGGVFNNPVLALAFLQPRFQSRFRFSIGRVERGRDNRPDVWIVNYREQDRPTILRGPNDSDLPASGSFWIEADTGRVLRTELQVTNDTVISFFEFDERFQIAVPVRMTDRYRHQNNIVSGTATYGRFRRFDITTEENVQ